MNYSKILVLSIVMMSGILSAMADKMSPDTRIRLEQRAGKVSAKTLKSIDASMQVFVAFEPGFDTSLLRIPGVEINSVFDKFATVTATPAALEAIAELDGVRYIQQASEVKLRNDFGRRDLHVNEVHHNTGGTLPQAYTGKGVVVGLIDTGVEYGHGAFYTSDGSQLRIRKVWEQNSYGKAPEGYSYGRELATEEEMLVSATDTRSQFHGCHTMGTAAGGGWLPTRYYGMAPDADIVYVSFKSDGNTAIADGIKYIFDYADEMDMPCVINMSLGSHQGPHDGSSYLDQVIDELTGPGRIIVGACGNEGESKMHVTKTFTATDKTMKTFVTFAAGLGEKRQYLDIWGTPGSNIKVSMAVFNSLKGQTVDRSRVFDTSDPTQSVMAYYTYLDEQGVDMDAVFYGEINPENNAPHVWIQSEVGNVGQGRMPGLIIEGEEGTTVHVWNVGQNEFSSNGKSGFTEGDHNSTVGEIGGTAKRIITVGSYDGRDSLISRRNWYVDMNQYDFYKQYQHSAFSSYGPTADGRTVPHILAPGLPVISSLNRYALEASEIEANMSDYTTDPTGRKFYYVYNMGTSMSAPHVAGIVALMLQANPELTPEDARKIIQDKADTWDEMGAVPNNTYGAGRINALECVRGAIELASVNEVEAGRDATQVWGEGGRINVLTPATGSTLRLYSVTGRLLAEKRIEEPSTVIDAAQWGRQILIAEIAGEKFRRTFKIAL